jgi:hypothetical protein
MAIVAAALVARGIEARSTFARDPHEQSENRDCSFAWQHRIESFARTIRPSVRRNASQSSERPPLNE